MKTLDKILKHIATSAQEDTVQRMSKLGYEFHSLLADGSIEMVAHGDGINTKAHDLIYIERNGELSNGK